MTRGYSLLNRNSFLDALHRQLCHLQCCGHTCLEQQEMSALVHVLSASYLHLNHSSGSRTCAHVRRLDCPSSRCAVQANLESSAPYWLLEAPDLVKRTPTDKPVLFSVALEPCQPPWPVLGLAPSSWVGALAVSCSVEALRTSLGPCCLRLWLPLLLFLSGQLCPLPKA